MNLIFSRTECSRDRVAAGVLPAVEPGVSPGGAGTSSFATREDFTTDPGGKMPPSTAGRMPAATGRAAFTMVEIALCLGVIGFALVAIIGILPSGMSVQKDNREETVINFDGTFLMNAIRTGAQGQDDLTNFIINITNYFTEYNSNNVVIGSSLNWYTTSGFSVGPNGASLNVLTNGANIIGLMSGPKYVPAGPPGSGNYFSNFTTADFRGLTGDAVDQGTNSGSQDFAFKYRVSCEIMPSASYAFYTDPTVWQNLTAPSQTMFANPNPPASLTALAFQTNFSQVRLNFRWPILPNGQTANGRLVFRSSVSGTFLNVDGTYGGVAVPFYYLRPGVL